MFARFRQYVLLLALLVLPVQGMAAALSALVCSGHEGAAHGVSQASDAHEHAVLHDTGVAHDHFAGGSEKTGSTDHANHLCCHHFASSAPGAVEKIPDADLSVYVPALSLLATLFVPEKPQRPPRG
jgi:hypothetical protein